MCALKSISVVCLNPSDVCQYLVDSYRPYQLRNNKLAATYDGARGQAAQVQVGLRALHNATAENPNPLAVAGRVVAGQRGAGQRGAGRLVAGPFVEGQRRASPQEEDERIAAYEKHSLPSGKYDFKAAVYHHILNKVCICASDHGWVPIVLHVRVS